jgi:hypothetical protein
VNCSSNGICEPICDSCANSAANDISALPLDYFDLMRDCARPIGASDVKISRPDPHGFPLVDVFVDELCSDIHWTLTVWEVPVREAARLAPETTARVRPGWAVSAAAGLLAAHVRVLASLPATVGYADGLAAGPVTRSGRYGITCLRTLHRRARARLGITRRVFRLPGECSSCSAWAFRRSDGGDTVWCESCGGRWTYDDYRRYVTLTVTSMGDLAAWGP